MNDFQYERFLALSNSDLVDYIHPILNDLTLDGYAIVVGFGARRVIFSFHRFTEEGS